jgi:hypothetical protein
MSPSRSDASRRLSFPAREGGTTGGGGRERGGEEGDAPTF